MAKRTIADLNIKLGANTASLSKDFDKAAGTVTGFKSNVSSMGMAVGSVFAKIGVMAAKAAAAIAASLAAATVAFAGWGVSLAAENQQAEVAFTTMLGSASKAKQALSDVRDFAAATPFQLPELRDATKMLLAFQVAQEDLIPTLRKVGDVSSGIGAPIGEIAEIYGKAKVQGRLFMEDINQLTGRGIPIITELAKQFGVTEAEVRDLVSSGKVGFEQLEQAFTDLTSEGGKFGGMMEAQSKTLSGRWSTLKDTFAAIAQEYGTKLIPIIIDGIDQLEQFLRGIELIGEDGKVSAEKMQVAFEYTKAAIAGVIKTSQWMVVSWYEAQSAAAEVYATVVDLYQVMLSVKKLNPSEWLLGNIEEIESELHLFREISKAVREAADERMKMSRDAAEGDWAASFLDRMKAESEAASAGIGALAAAVESINGTTAAEANAATEDLEQVIAEVKSLKFGGGVAAVDVRSTGGFSALMAGASVARDQAVTARNQLAESRKQTQYLADIRTATQRGGAVTVVQNRI
jgi:tape measure domain-containing protein